MMFTFTLLAAFVSAAVAAPAMHKRQSVCPLQNFNSVTIVTAGESSLHTRWDIFTVNEGLITVGDVAWIGRGSPNGNEAFKATVGSSPNLFQFNRVGGQSVGVSGTDTGSKLLAAPNAATFKVTCSSCDTLAGSNGLAANGCTMELTDGTNGLGQCVNFEAAVSVAKVEPCDGSLGQNMAVFVV
ncbi:hypothetical protein C8R46DRAFT_1321606 [Mycena filopes]|nr:hypothetical protein C8R46DRAFT_1321606 [Mycena filopes]